MLASDFKDVVARRTVSISRWPTLVDFESRSVWVPQQPLEAVLFSLRKGVPVVISGGQGRGKSVLAKVVGFHLLENDKDVYMLDCTPKGSQTIESIMTMIRNLEASGRRPTWIVEDIQNDHEQMAVLYPLIQKCRSSRFIYVWRQAVESEIAADTEWVDDLLETATIVRLKPDPDLIQQIVDGYIVSHRNEQRFEQHGGVTVIQDCRRLLGLTGGDLRQISAYLSVWDPRVTTLSMLKPEMILRSLWLQNLKPLLKFGQPTLDTYLQLSAVGQLDVDASTKGYGTETLEKLKEQGLISASYRFEHASDAKMTIETFASHTHQSVDGVNNELLLKYLDHIDIADLVDTPAFGSRHLIHLMSGILATRLKPSMALVSRFEYLVVNSKGYATKTQYIKTFCRVRSDVRAFIGAIGGLNFASSLIQARTEKMMQFLTAVRRVDPALANEIQSELVKLFARCDIKRLAKCLIAFMSTERTKPLAKAILNRFCSDNPSRLIKESSAASCGLLMNVVKNIDEQTAYVLALTIADHVPLYSEDNAEKLSVLARNLQINQVAQVRLLNRILRECNATRLTKEGKIDGSAYLLSHIAGYLDKVEDIGLAKKFANNLRKHLTRTQVQGFNNRSVLSLLWSALLIGEGALEWLETFREDLPRRIETIDRETLFWLLWNIVQIDDAFFKSFAGTHKDILKKNIVSATLASWELALLGMLEAWVDWDNPSLAIAPTAKVAAELLEKESASHHLFALKGAYRVSGTTFNHLHEALSEDVGDLAAHLEDLISKNVVSSSRDYLRGIARQLGLNENKTKST